MSLSRTLIAVGVMALVTYLPRMLPLVLFKKRITQPFLRSFLSYVPYAVLAAMTFPDVLSSTASLISGAAGLLCALLMAYRGRSLLAVALSSVGTVFVVEQLLRLLHLL